MAQKPRHSLGKKYQRKIEEGWSILIEILDYCLRECGLES